MARGHGPPLLQLPPATGRAYLHYLVQTYSSRAGSGKECLRAVTSGVAVYLIAPMRGLCTPYLCKIGKAKDTGQRLRQLNQSQPPYPLNLLWEGSGYHPEEVWLHKRFAARRAHGEWFDFDDVDDPIGMVSDAHAECLAEFADRPRVIIAQSGDGSWVCRPQVSSGRSKQVTSIGEPYVAESLEGALAAARSYLSGRGEPEELRFLADWYARSHGPPVLPQPESPATSPPPEPPAVENGADLTAVQALLLGGSRMAYNLNEVADVAGIERARLRKRVKGSGLPVIKLGSRTLLIHHQDAPRWLEWLSGHLCS